jgi:hypothetical protein
MKTSRRIILITVIALAILLILATPAMADPRMLVCYGDPDCRINVLQGTPEAYPAGEPFFIIHNVYVYTGVVPVANGLSGFALEVDGVYVEPSWNFKGGGGWPADPPPNFVASGSAFNFPQGLSAGEHTFIGHWYVACLPQDGCEPPVKQIEFGTAELTVTFVP